MSASALPVPRIAFGPGEIRVNVLAGLVVGVIAIPLSIALAVAIGLSPSAGLYTAAFAGATAALFGGSRFNITGPTAALVPILSHAVVTHGPEALPTIGVMAGGLLLVMSHFKLGRLMRYMPGLVVVGFTAGIALSIAFGQLNSLLGVQGTDASLEHFHEKIFDTVAHLGTVGFAAPAMGIAAVAALMTWPRIPVAGRIPGPLVAVVVATGIAWAFGVDVATIGSRYGDLPSGVPTPTFTIFDPGLAFDVLPIAVSVAVLGAVESLLSAMVADGMAPGVERHDSNRELMGQGLANLVSPIMGGVPATAAIARTAAGIRSGATSRLTGVVHALTVLAATVLLGGMASHIPLTVLAAILLVVAWNIAEVPELLRLARRAPRADVAILLSTAGITLFFDLTYAIGAGVLASMLLLVRSLMRVPATREVLPDDERRPEVSAELHELVKERRDVAVFTAQGILSFHCAATFEYELRGSGQRPLVIKMKNVHHIDSTGLLTLEGIIEHHHRIGGRLMLSSIQPEVYPVLERFGIIEAVGRANIFERTVDAIASCAPPNEAQQDGRVGGSWGGVLQPSAAGQ